MITCILNMGILTLGFLEAIWGVLQMCGVINSDHMRYSVTGTFYNPGPYGCMLGAILPLAVYLYLKIKKRSLKQVCMVYFLLSALLLPGCMSRTGWIAAIVGSAVALTGIYLPKLHTIGTRKLIVAVAVAVVATVAVGYGSYRLKPDSADGRLLTWKIAADGAASLPLSGAGWENVAGVYGDAQERYFSSAEATDRERMVAGAPMYVFNEYIQIAIAFGVPAAATFTLLMAVALALYWRNGSYGIAGTVVAVGICCMASYPFQFMSFKLLTSILIVVSFLTMRRRRNGIAASMICCLGAVLFCTHTPQIDVQDEFRTATMLKKEGLHRKSNNMLFELLPRTADPMPLNIIGLNYQAMGMRDSAAFYFHRAALRVPNRMFPHYLLMRLHFETEADRELAEKEARLLLDMIPKVDSPATITMKKEAELTLDSLARVKEFQLSEKR